MEDALVGGALGMAFLVLLLGVWGMADCVILNALASVIIYNKPSVT